MQEQEHFHDAAARHQLTIAAPFKIIQIVSVVEWSGFKAKFDANVLLYLLSHFECDDHTVHMLTQLRPQPPLTSTVKSLLFTFVHFSPPSLAARLHQCHVNYSSYFNNGWNISIQVSYHTYIHTYTHTALSFYILFAQ